MTDSEIRNAALKVREELAAEQKRHEKRVARLRADLSVIRHKCPHRETDYEWDASGNGGEMVCLVCGKCARRL
jgi:hypothetical protein